MITTAPKMEPNRLERVAAGNLSNTPLTVAAAAKTDTAAVPSVPAVKTETTPVSPILAKNETPETPAAPDRVVSMTPSQQIVPPQPQPVVAREDFAAQIDNAKRIREGELRKQAVQRESERRTEQRRRKRQEIDAAVMAVKRMQRDGVLQAASQQDDGPRLGFFGQD